MKDDIVFRGNNGQALTNSLLVAEKFGKEHSDVLKSIDAIRAKIPDNQCKGYFSDTYIEVPQPNGGVRRSRVVVMNRDGFTLLVMGFTGEKAFRFKMDYIEAFNRMEEQIKTGGFQIPQSFAEALMLAAKQQEQIDAQNKIIEEQKPAVIFTNSIRSCNTNILIRDLAKLITQNGHEIGEQRLYEWMVQNKYLIRHQRFSKSKGKYVNYYTPTQSAAKQKLFWVSERTIANPGEDAFIKFTCYITGKGQVYFINKFVKGKPDIVKVNQPAQNCAR